MFDQIKKWASGLAGSKAVAAHIRIGGNHAIAFAALRVLVCQDGEEGLWFAQAIDIDYSAGGATAEDAKARFERGLAATVHANLERFGTIERMLKTPPAGEWLPLISKSESYEFSVSTVHELPGALSDARFPVRRVEYLQDIRRAAAA